MLKCNNNEQQGLPALKHGSGFARVLREAFSHQKQGDCSMKRAQLAVLAAAVVAAFGLVPAAHAIDAAVKAAVCIGCHGPEGRSVIPANPILAGQHSDYLAAALKAYNKGEREHGVPGRLSDEDINLLAAYFAQQAPVRSMVEPAGDATVGKPKTAACAACHGADGNSTNPSIPLLAGQHAAYLGKALRAYRSGARSNPMMAPAMFESLSDEDIDAIAAYFASQSPRASSGDGGR
jgi:cytochrome c553